MSELYYRFPGSFEDVQFKVTHLRERASLLADAAEKAKCDSIREFAALYASFAGCMDLLAKLLPYKAGDRVRLVDPPECNGGWAGSKHFLVEGAIGTVKSVSLDYLMRDWCVYVEFDDESHIASLDYVHWETKVPYKAGDRVPTPVDRRHVYGLKPNRVEPASATSRIVSRIHDRDPGDEQVGN